MSRYRRRVRCSEVIEQLPLISIWAVLGQWWAGDGVLAGPELSTPMLPCTIILHDHQPGPWHHHHHDPTTFNDLTISSSTITNNEECAVIFHRSLLTNLLQSQERQLGDAALLRAQFHQQTPGSPTR